MTSAMLQVAHAGCTLVVTQTLIVRWITLSVSTVNVPVLLILGTQSVKILVWKVGLLF